MKRLEFLITVPDKYTRQEYKAGKQYEFEDKRADEILAARTSVTNEPYAKVVEDEVVENVEKPVEEIKAEKPKRTRKTKKD